MTIITEGEIQRIINTVLSSIRTNSRRIDQLSVVTQLYESDYFEINGGKRIAYKNLRDLIYAVLREDIDKVWDYLRDIVEGSHSDGIDNLNEIIAFLEGIKDTETLLEKFEELKKDILLNVDGFLNPQIVKIYRGHWNIEEDYYCGDTLLADPNGRACYERSEVERYGCLWLCNETGTKEAPMFGKSDAWTFESGLDIMQLMFDTTEDTVDAIEPHLRLGVICTIGNHDFTNEGVIRFDWTRQSWHGETEQTASDSLWNSRHSNIGSSVELAKDDFNYSFGTPPTKLIITVTATLIGERGQAEAASNGEPYKVSASFELTEDN